MAMPAKLNATKSSERAAWGPCQRAYLILAAWAIRRFVHKADFPSVVSKMPPYY